MQKYVTQLIADILVAKSNVPEKPNVRVLYPDHPALDFGLDYMAEWECAPEVQMKELVGLNPDIFPAVEKLTEKQMEDITNAILELWAAFNFFADVPEGLPSSLLYKELVKQMREDTVRYVSEGACHLGFCDYMPEECPWGSDYCTCQDFADDEYVHTPMTPEQEAEWNKGLRQHPDGSTSWVNPELLDENGDLKPKKFPKFDEGDDLPF